MPSFKNYYSYLFKTDDLKSKYQTLVFAAFAILLALAVSRHEPWMDEAQAWLLVKDADPIDVFVKYLRYEGSPGLWHLILMIPAKLGLPYFTLNILSAVFAAAGVWLFLRHAPFPPIIKILFPFSYFVLFQYAVVARSYCLIPLLLFSIARIYPNKIQQPVLFSFLLALLANVSTHTFLMAGGIFAVHLLDVAKEWKTLDKPTRNGQIGAVLLLGSIALVIYLLLKPAPDHFLGNYNNWSLANFFNVSKFAISGALAMDESSPFRWIQMGLSLGIFFVTVVWLRQRKLTLLYLLPLLFIFGLFAVRYRNLWHDGVTFFLWVFVLWIGFEKGKNQAENLLVRLFPILITFVLATQVFWTLSVIRNDYYQSYSGSYELAEYIKGNQLEDRKIFISGWKSVAISPYFDRNIFYNLNNGAEERFWKWSDSNETPLGAFPEVVDSIQSEDPDIIIIASDHLDLNDLNKIEGYRPKAIFHGRLFWKTGFHELNSYWVFEKDEPE
jgi:hypothetical protein